MVYRLIKCIFALMSEYHFQEIEKRWQSTWRENQTYRTTEDISKPKYYVLDMFPYPSGAGLHVGHPLGYIASDIVARYKRQKGFNVLHPMGYDAFGLPAEQYAIQTGQHPAITTETNITTYRRQLDNIGFSFDWSREVRTCEPAYYKWTQWIFIELFNSWYNNATDKAESIDSLIQHFAANGSAGINAVCDEHSAFSASEWNAFNESQQEEILQCYRLAFNALAEVNWCPALGTVLANDEVINGKSERGGHPVIRKKMQQWCMRITAYAQRLLDGLEKVEWSDSIKEIQRNWIGRSKGASVTFNVVDSDAQIEVFTTRPDTIFGVSFVVLAPEHDLVDQITPAEFKAAVDEYREIVATKSEIDRMADVKTVSGVFTGAYVSHPFTGEKVPVWLADYVLAGYGTGAVMGVPGGDDRDWRFARHFGLPIVPTCENTDIEVGANASKDEKIINSDFLNGLTGHQGIEKAIEALEAKGAGKGKINYRLRDAIFSRQRYWGEPFPIYYENGIPRALDNNQLPVILPEVDKYLPTEEGEPPLARAKDWKFDCNTMPGWAGSSWYFIRYMDPTNEHAFADPEKIKYWDAVDLYVGGSEHATGHLLYARFWTKFLFDRGYIPFDEPFKKMVNQGMIQGMSQIVYRVGNTNSFVSHELRMGYDVTPLHVDVNLVKNGKLNQEGFRNWRPDYANAEFITENGDYFCGSEVEKMSKSKWNVVNPDMMIEEYGADTLRLYEMFLGPLEMAKPWDTNGIEGVHRFLKKFWRLFHPNREFSISEEAATKDELKVLHKTIKKVEEDIARFSFNTTVSAFMIAVNELSDLKCNKRAVLEPMTILLAPFAPHIAEELWSKLGHASSVTQEQYPAFDESLLVQNTHVYPVMINGKKRADIELELSLDKGTATERALAMPEVQKWLEGKAPKNVVVVPGKIINVVV